MRALLKLAALLAAAIIAACTVVPIVNVSDAPVSSASGWIQNLNRGITAQLAAS